MNCLHSLPLRRVSIFIVAHLAIQKHLLLSLPLFQPECLDLRSHFFPRKPMRVQHTEISERQVCGKQTGIKVSDSHRCAADLRALSESIFFTSGSRLLPRS
jgi:hypothetical protein